MQNPVNGLTFKWGLFFLGGMILMFACHNVSNEKNHSEIHDPIVEVSQVELADTVKDSIPVIIKKPAEPVPKSLSSGQMKVPDNISSELPNFSVYTNTVKKKKAFFSFLGPIVIEENRKVLVSRDYILSQMRLSNSGHDLSKNDIKKLEDLADQYRLKNHDVGSPDFFRDLLLHVDVIPEELALVQAANESAWGSSYFARKGNNLFGQWCFTPGCGEVPRQRKAGDTHEVAVYVDLSHSVRSYIQYLNSHPAFGELRSVRYSARESGNNPSGYDMALGLKQYSGIGTEYVTTLRSMIKKNRQYMDITELNESLK